MSLFSYESDDEEEEEEERERQQVREERAARLEYDMRDRALVRSLVETLRNYVCWKTLVPTRDDGSFNTLLFIETFGDPHDIFRLTTLEGEPVAQSRKGETRHRVPQRDLLGDETMRVLRGGDDESGNGISLERVWVRAAWRVTDAPCRRPNLDNVRFYHDDTRNDAMIRTLKERAAALRAGRLDWKRFAFEGTFFTLRLQEHDVYAAPHSDDDDEPQQAQPLPEETISGGEPGEQDLYIVSGYDDRGIAFFVYINRYPDTAHWSVRGPSPPEDFILEFFSVHLNAMLVSFIEEAFP